jgi:hypothetical protein
MKNETTVNDKATMKSKEHWEGVYSTKSTDAVILLAPPLCPFGKQ